MTDRTGHADCVVIGGGVAGLVAGWEVARAGRQPLVLEAGDVVGGAVRRHRVGGLDLDAGAESYAVAGPAVSALIADLGMADDIVAPNPVGAWVRHRAGSARLPAAALLGIPARPWAADVRRVIGVSGVLRAGADRLLPAAPIGTSGATVADVVRARLGRRVLDRLVEPVTGSVYAAAPDRLELRQVAPQLVEAALAAGSLTGGVRAVRPAGQRPGSAVAGLAGGLHRLPAALRAGIESLGGIVRTGAAVTAVQRDGLGWTVLDAGGHRVSSPRLLLATPAAEAARLLSGAAPRSANLGAVTLPPADVVLCTLVLDDPRLDGAPRGTGVLVSAAVSDVTAKALTHATAKWAWLATDAGPGRHVLRLSYGRARSDRPGSAGWVPPADPPDPAELIATALADASTLLGVPLRAADVLDAAVTAWPAFAVAPPGHRQAVERARAALEPERAWLVGAGMAGVGLAAVIPDAQAQAARIIAARPADDAAAPRRQVPGRG